MKEHLCIEEIGVSEIGERYGTLRIVSPRADAAMVKSIRKYGQMTPVVFTEAFGEIGSETRRGWPELAAELAGSVGNKEKAVGVLHKINANLITFGGYYEARRRGDLEKTKRFKKLMKKGWD